jgi:hypothetical protein
LRAIFCEFKCKNFVIKIDRQSGMFVVTSNPSIWEVEAEGLYLKASLGHIAINRRTRAT